MDRRLCQKDVFSTHDAVNDGVYAHLSTEDSCY